MSTRSAWWALPTSSFWSERKQGLVEREQAARLVADALGNLRWHFDRLERAFGIDHFVREDQFVAGQRGVDAAGKSRRQDPAWAVAGYEYIGRAPGGVPSRPADSHHYYPPLVLTFD